MENSMDVNSHGFNTCQLVSEELKEETANCLKSTFSYEKVVVTEK